MQIIQWIMDHQAIELGILFGISEALSFLPGVAANGVFQAIYNFLKGKLGK